MPVDRRYLRADATRISTSDRMKAGVSMKIRPSLPRHRSGRSGTSDWARTERVILFLAGGGSAAMLNLALAWAGVEILGLRSALQQNFVNLVAMEVSLLYSFFVYRKFVWKIKDFNVSRVFLRELPLYHLSAGASVLTRLSIFPVLQTLGVHYLINISFGIALGAAVNYLLADRFVFKRATHEEDG